METHSLSLESPCIICVRTSMCAKRSDHHNHEDTLITRLGPCCRTSIALGVTACREMLTISRALFDRACLCESSYNHLRAATRKKSTRKAKMVEAVQVVVMVVMVIMVMGLGVEGAVDFPAMFVFGDSLTDSGNNNGLKTLAKASHPPYGRDFPPSSLPTGRFCNGPLSTDYIAALAGLPYLPPYLSTSEDNMLQGVTFASASAGILNSSGSLLGEHLSLSKQVTCFASAKEVLVQKLGLEKADNLISRSLFYISIGSNDYLENYLATGPLGSILKSPLQWQYSASQFTELLQSNLERHVVDLYKMGARKMALVSLSALGCLPVEMSLGRNKGGKCIESINTLTHGYNAALLQRMERLQRTYSDCHFTYLNSYDFLYNIVQNPSSYGFDNANTPCCGSAGPFIASPCRQNSTSICADASKYVFWDFVHPSSALNKKIADTFWAGSPPSVQPYNLKQLAALD